MLVNQLVLQELLNHLSPRENRHPLKEVIPVKCDSS